MDATRKVAFRIRSVNKALFGRMRSVETPHDLFDGLNLSSLLRTIGTQRFGIISGICNDVRSRFGITLIQLYYMFYLSVLMTNNR